MIIRWVCSKCDKKWIYPIAKCISCKSEIIKQRSIKSKVIGITKVNIPSPYHPIVPYYILLLEDEFGNKLPKKVMKERKIGDVFEFKPAKTESAVSIAKVKYDIKEALSESLSLLSSFPISSDDKVLIVPTLIEPAYPYQASNVNPKLLAQLIVLLKEKGVKDILVGTQAMIGSDATDCAKKSGVLDALKSLNVEFRDLGKGEFIEKKAKDVSFSISKEAIERKIISLAALKTHAQIGMSGVIENMLRVCDEKTQKKMFVDDCEKMIPTLLTILKPSLSIGDASLGLHGQGPTALGEPAFLNLIYSSKDPLALDSAFCYASMIPLPIYLKEAHLLGVGSAEAKKNENVGEEIDSLRFPLKQASKERSGHPSIRFIDGKSDPFVFSSALRISQKLVGILGEELFLVMGTQFTKEMIGSRQRIILYGEDAIKKGEELGLEPIARISGDADEVEKLVLIKSVLENPEKKKIGVADAFKAKFAAMTSKGKGG